MAEVLSGSREKVSLASVLQLIDAELVTGWLELPGAGRIGFREGQIQIAECGSLTGADAVRSLFLSDGHGGFSMSTSEVEAGSPVGPLIALIMDGVRLTDEWNRLAPKRLARTPWYQPKGRRVDAVIGLLDGERTVFEAAQQAGVEPVYVVDVVLELLEGAVLREEAPADEQRVEALRDQARRAAVAEPEPEPEPDPLEGLDSFDLTDLGRRRLRERDYSGAEEAFERALTLDPDSRILTQNLRRVRQLRDAGGPAYARRSW